MKKKLILLIALSMAFQLVKAQKIEFKKSFGTNIFFKDGKQISQKKVLELMKENKKAFDIMKSAKHNADISKVFAFLGGGFIGFPMGTAIGGGDAKWELAGIGAVLIGVSIPFNTALNKKSKKAIELYNSELETVSSYFKPNFNFNFKGSSISLTMNF